MLAILISLPLTPVLWHKARLSFGTSINGIAYIILALIAVLLVLYMLRRRKRFGIFSFLSLVGLSVAYAYLLRYQCKFPAERLHLVVYGLLVFFLYEAFRLDFSNVGSYAFAFIFSSIFGTVDELVQYLLPNRTFEIRDITTNILGSALGLIVIAILVRMDAVGVFDSILSIEQ
jgi:glycopeptide antibiotics resistance protein